MKSLDSSRRFNQIILQIALMLIGVAINSYAGLLNLSGVEENKIDQIDGIDYFPETGIVCWGRIKSRHYIWITSEKDKTYSTVSFRTHSRDYTRRVIPSGHNRLIALIKHGAIKIWERPDQDSDDWYLSHQLNHEFAFAVVPVSDQQFVTVSHDHSMHIWSLKNAAPAKVSPNIREMGMTTVLAEAADKSQFYSLIESCKETADSVLLWTPNDDGTWSYSSIANYTKILGIHYLRNQSLLVIGGEKYMPDIGWRHYGDQNPPSCVMAWTEKHPEWKPVTDRSPECTHILPNGDLLLEGSGTAPVHIAQMNDHDKRWSIVKLSDPDCDITCRSDTVCEFTVLRNGKIVTAENKAGNNIIRIWTAHNRGYSVKKLVSRDDFPKIFCLLELRTGILAAIYDTGLMEWWDLEL